VLKIGINGYGRIGRTILRALYEQNKRAQLQIVAINDLGDANINAHLTRYDTVHGRFSAEVKVDNDALIVNDDRIQVLSEHDPAKLPWAVWAPRWCWNAPAYLPARRRPVSTWRPGRKKC